MKCCQKREREIWTEIEFFFFDSSTRFLDLGRYWLHKCRSMTYRSFFSPTLLPRFNDFFYSTFDLYRWHHMCGNDDDWAAKNDDCNGQSRMVKTMADGYCSKKLIRITHDRIAKIHPLSTCFKVAPRAINLERSIVQPHKHYSKQLIQNHLKFNRQPSTGVS